MPKITGKTYKCQECGSLSSHATNHYGDCYPECPTCRKVTVHEFVGEAPEGAWIPEKWKIVKLGDVCDIVRGSVPQPGRL